MVTETVQVVVSQHTEVAALTKMSQIVQNNVKIKSSFQPVPPRFIGIVVFRAFHYSKQTEKNMFS